MKARKTLSALTRIIAIAALVAVIGGCAAGGDSPQDLVRRFFSDVNAGNYDNITSYLDSSAQNYNQVNQTYWENALNPDYTINSLSGDGPVTAQVTEGTGTDTTFEFTFSGSEGNMFNPSDYKIKMISDGGSTIFQ